MHLKINFQSAENQGNSSRTQLKGCDASERKGSNVEVWVAPFFPSLLGGVSLALVDYIKGKLGQLL